MILGTVVFLGVMYALPRIQLAAEVPPTAVKIAAEPSGAGQLTKVECLQLGSSASDYSRCRELLGYDPLQPVTKPTDAPAAPKATPAGVTMNSSGGGSTKTLQPVNTTAQGAWSIKYFEGSKTPTDFTLWKFVNINPTKCTLFPNVDNPCNEARDGLEFGQQLSLYAQHNQDADFNTAAGHYRLYSGSYSIDGVASCESGKEADGCAIFVVNVGNVTAMWRNQMFDAGYTLTGRYWNGDKLTTAMWAGMSHMAYNMLNKSGDSTNMGANCSVRQGCQTLHMTFVITSGNQVLVIGTSIVKK